VGDPQGGTGLECEVLPAGLHAVVEDASTSSRSPNESSSDPEKEMVQTVVQKVVQKVEAGGGKMVKSGGNGRGWKNSWQVVVQGNVGGFVLAGLHPAPVEMLAEWGYGSVGKPGVRVQDGPGSAGAFLKLKRNKGAGTTHVFVRPEDLPGNASALHPVPWYHSISFWVDNLDAFDEASCPEFMRQFIADLAVEKSNGLRLMVDPEPRDRFTDPKSGRQARTFDVALLSKTHPLTKEDSIKIMGALQGHVRNTYEDPTVGSHAKTCGYKLPKQI